MTKSLPKHECAYMHIHLPECTQQHAPCVDFESRKQMCLSKRKDSVTRFLNKRFCPIRGKSYQDSFLHVCFHGQAPRAEQRTCAIAPRAASLGQVRLKDTCVRCTASLDFSTVACTTSLDFSTVACATSLDFSNVAVITSLDFSTVACRAGASVARDLSIIFVVHVCQWRQIAKGPCEFAMSLQLACMNLCACMRNVSARTQTHTHTHHTHTCFACTNEYVMR
jgi:hypothetical protein